VTLLAFAAAERRAAVRRAATFPPRPEDGTVSVIQWRINHDANDAMAWGPPLKGAPRAAV